MKTTLTYITALLLVPLAALCAPDGSKPTSDAAWPLLHMRELPTDYLERLRHALQLEADKFDDARFEKADVTKVRVGIASLALRQHVEQVNAVFEADGFAYAPHEDFGFSLFSLPYVRVYGLFNERTGVMKGRLSAKAQANLEKTLWSCAKANSKLAEAQRDVWAQEGSENHHMTSKVSDFLVAQFLKDIPAYAQLKYDDGSTLQQQYEARLAYWSKWLDERARRGLFEEDGSSYQNYVIEALFNLHDLCEDPVLRRKAGLFLDLVFANFAEETLGTQRGGPKTRTKEEHFRSAAYDLLFDAPGAEFTLSDYLLSTSSYYPSPAIVSLAKEFRQRGTYSFVKRAPDAVVIGSREHLAVPRSKWSTLDKTNTMTRVGFATPHYIAGSHSLDPSAKVEDSREQRWQGIVFANDPMARIGMDGKSGVTKGGYISNPFNTIQDRNLMVTLKWGPIIDKGTDPHLWIYLSYALDAVEEEDGWIFVRSGDAFAAVKVVEGGYIWSPAWKHSDAFSPKDKSFIRLNAKSSPIITIANDAADYHNDFASFKKALKEKPIHWKDGVLKFATITHDGTLKAGKINGQAVIPRPSRVNDSPFIRSEWDSGLIYLRKGNETEILDFRDPQNPKKTIGAPVTAEFPPGEGNTQPLIFGKGAQ